jgi:hypothetical protein
MRFHGGGVFKRFHTYKQNGGPCLNRRPALSLLITETCIVFVAFGSV